MESPSATAFTTSSSLAVYPSGLNLPVDAWLFLASFKSNDSDFVREGMRIILGVDEEFEVLGCASDGKEAIEIARNLNALVYGF